MAASGGSERKIKMCDINEMITCKICSGYLVDATTIVECLHTFCKSCIVKHLNSEDNNTCPQCEEVIHQSHPLNYIKFDRTMQDIVYKLVPNLETAEYKLERDFYAEKGVPCPKDVEAEMEKDEKIKKEEEEDQTPENTANTDYHRFDEHVNLVLEAKADCKMKDIRRKFIRCSSLTTITHLKKFIALKCLDTMDKYKDLDVTCDGELIPKDHTLKFVYITRWRTKPAPLKLVYSPKIDLDKEIEENHPKKSSKQNQAPQWKLQPKLNYDDDDDEN